MKLSVSFILLCFAVVTYAAPKIIGGKDAPDGKYPYMVSIRFDRSLICGGSILNKRWILTAAHCITGGLFPPEYPYNIVAGTNLLEGGNEQNYTAEYGVFHPKYNNPEGSYSNDIGIIRVNKDIEFNDKVQPIALPDKEFYGTGYPVKLSGWGHTTDRGSPNNLQEIDLKIDDLEHCKATMEIATDTHVCTLTKAGEGACYGDSGSPLVADGVQIGIASYVHDDGCAKGYPDLFTRVYSFLDWIAIEQAKFQTD